MRLFWFFCFSLYLYQTILGMEVPYKEAPNNSIHTEIHAKRCFDFSLLQDLLLNGDVDHQNMFNKPDENGDTPLHLAVKYKSPAAVILSLYRYGACLFTKNNADLTPVQLAIQRNNDPAEAMLSILIKEELAEQTY